MPIWPFRRRRRASAVQDAPPDQTSPLSEKVKQPAAVLKSKRRSTAKSTSRPSTKRAKSPPPDVAPTPPLPRRGSQKTAQHRQPASQHGQAIPGEKLDSENRQSSVTKDTKDKENLPPPPTRAIHASREDITALPFRGRLDHSPHLRPVDVEKRPQIPYNFRPHSMSQTSVQKQEATATRPRRPNTLHSKRSTQDYSSPARRTSSRNSRKRDDAVREEEIRAMSQPIPIPKRTGDGPLRRDSKKFRGLLSKDSEVSLPPEGSFHSGMSGVVEQRGWEIGSLAVFNPRPAVRLSGTPQYVPSQSLPSGMIYRIDSRQGQEKTPVTADNARKRRTVGDEADDLDASDIRAIMERDAKRREQRHKDRQERLERKLMSREGRNRGDSDVRRQRDAEEQRRIEEGRARAQQQVQAQGPLTPPVAIHPALRSQEAQAEPVGLGIGQARPVSPDPMDLEPTQPASSPSHELVMQGLETHQEEEDDAPEDPFSDAQEQLPASPSRPHPSARSHTSLPMESPMEEPEVRTAQAVRMSLANTPPLSPVYGSHSAQLSEAMRQQSISATSASDLPPPPPIAVERRSSDPPKERRAGAWATFFRRGNTVKSRRNENAVSPAETGFSNISRESMRNQPLPAHLVGTDRPPAVRSMSGTPVRTQSKFREDLPEMPISPPESRQQSPDIMTSAAAVAAARRAGRSTPQPIDIPGRLREQDRNDTPVSRGHTAMASSLASIDSEGSWLAGGEKRQSKQSGLSRSYSKRNADFSASYEELGGDKDAEYLNRNRESRSRKLSSPALLGADPEEASDEEETLERINAEASEEPLTVHSSVRRKPTLVQRDPRLKSREGLVQEYLSAETSDVFETPAESPDETYEPESPTAHEPVHLERATSVQYGSRHSRQFSAGSAKLLDVQSSRQSKTPTPEPSSAAATPKLQ